MQPPILRGSLISLLRSKALKSGNDLKTLTGSVVIFNTESLFHFFTNTDYRNYVVNASYICIDGAILVLCSYFFGKALPRYHGPDFLDQMGQADMLAEAALIGGHEGAGTERNKSIFGQWLQLPVADSGAFLAKKIAPSLSSSPPRVLVVSLGLPKQEIFSQALIGELPGLTENSLLVPAGAAVDFLNGSKARSSKFWRRIGLEWLPRLLREPRMWRRNALSLIGLGMLIKHEVMA